MPSEIGAPYKVVWLPQANKELRAIKDVREQAAIRHAAQVLAVNGPKLNFPHQSAAKGKHGKGLRELRPRRGRSRWRPIYRRVTPDTYVILAVGPEAKIDSSGFQAASKRAQKRLAELETK